MFPVDSSIGHLGSIAAIVNFADDDDDDDDGADDGADDGDDGLVATWPSNLGSNLLASSLLHL
eukprot:12021487-Karenia_brevis.AAC.1